LRRRLERQGRQGCADIADFVETTVPPLESLKLVDLGLDSLGSLLDIITHQHARSLKHLTLTARNNSNKDNPLLDTTAVGRLYNSCPHLESLTLALAAATLQWDYPLLQTLMSHRAAPPRDAPRPLIHLASTPPPPTSKHRCHHPNSPSLIPPRLGLFCYLCEQKVGAQLETLTVRVSSPRRADESCYSSALDERMRWGDDDQGDFDVFDTLYNCFVDGMGLEVCPVQEVWEGILGHRGRCVQRFF
jgi:hypothetical protein